MFQIETPSKVYLEYDYLQTKPFYRKVWFVVALAAASIVIIIMVVAILCVKSKTYKYKGKCIACHLYHMSIKMLVPQLNNDTRTHVTSPGVLSHSFPVVCSSYHGNITHCPYLRSALFVSTLADTILHP